MRHTRGGEDDEVISKLDLATSGDDAGRWQQVSRLPMGVATLCALVTRRATRRFGIVERAEAMARMTLARGALCMATHVATTVAAVTRGHVPSQRETYGVPVVCGHRRCRCGICSGTPSYRTAISQT